MADVLVPQQDGMKQTGHRDEKSYRKYIQNQSGIKDRAAQRIISGEICNGELLSYEAALKEEQLRFRKLQDTILPDIVAPVAAVEVNVEALKNNKEVN
ncbi:hypothetical protein R1sor_022962 [Riccia sorocarpa]|uniref:Uncharacterized protein n=1 Tax=Riccia sorocarpa TaxID=122646 RepID=A0ABD3GQ98_9MARC